MWYVIISSQNILVEEILNIEEYQASHASTSYTMFFPFETYHDACDFAAKCIP